jgi:hypothetical protein
MNASPRRYMTRQTLMILAVVVLAIIGVAYFMLVNLVPRTYSDSELSVTYPTNWKTVETDRMSECVQQPEGRHCLAVLVRAPDYLTKIIVVRQDLPTASTLEQEEAYFWARVSSNANTMLDERLAVTLDGKPAILRTYSFQVGAGSGFEMSITMLDGQTLYQVFANAEERQVLLDSRAEIQGIIDTLHFTG